MMSSLISSPKTVLVTGGAGFIGSHTCIELLELGYTVVVVDNLCNSSEESLNRVQRITGKSVAFHKVDLLNVGELEAVFQKYTIDSIIHFAALKAVGESVEQPLSYYQNNLDSTLNLLKCMKKYGVKKIVFSSSATVYSPENPMPVSETGVLGASNPYGRTKLFVEEIMRDVAKAEKDWQIVLLRYFNPTGAHKSGLIGEDPRGRPNNLMPFVLRVAVGVEPSLTVHGGDYDTPDGTGVRDYIHVCDLAAGHSAALRYMDRSGPGCEVFNLGCGRGYSVLDMVKAMEEVCGKKIPYTVGPRRAGDLGAVYANPSKAESMLQWKATRDVKDMCSSNWLWQSQNPKGYSS